VPTSRLEAFSDGVLAIAITLLVLEVKIPSREGAGLAHQLLDQWPAYLSYGVSFLTIGIIWANHHAMFVQIGKADRAVLYLNLGLLMCIAFIPFPTAVVAEFVERSDDQRPAALLYGATLTLCAVFFNALWQYAIRRPGILREDADPREIRGITRSYWPGTFIYGGATVVALASPIASVALFGAIALFYMLPSGRWAGG
jgi:uncharacterized membrane protein